MQDAALAYAQTAKITQSPRDLEASLLLKAAGHFRVIKEGWEEHKAQLDDALLYNRKLWTVLVSSATAEDSPLPIEVKNNIGSLGVFVFNQTLELQRDPKPEKLSALININAELAAGLNAMPAAGEAE